jgi:hypothetical protein
MGATVKVWICTSDPQPAFEAFNATWYSPGSWKARKNSLCAESGKVVVKGTSSVSVSKGSAHADQLVPSPEAGSMLQYAVYSSEQTPSKFTKYPETVVSTRCTRSVWHRWPELSAGTSVASKPAAGNSLTTNGPMVLIEGYSWEQSLYAAMVIW